MRRLLCASMVGTLAAGAALAGAPVWAQSAGQVVNFLDKNNDGQCNLDEYLAFQQTRIAQFDEDKDGELTVAEFRASLDGKAKRNAAPLFKGANVEGGRTLTQREFLGYHAWIFNNFLDGDKNGLVSPEEFAKVVGGR